MRDDDLRLEDFRAQCYDKLRYGATDAQGHVNNAAYSTFLESARSEILYARDESGGAIVLDADCGYVIVRLELDFVAETHWPGTVRVGSRILTIGRSSIALAQGVFQDGKLVAKAKTVMVQVNLTSRKPQELSERARTALKPYL